ncbi:MAG TPA: GyrI-like domain-containing protein [Sulfurovum sp.]|nr:GyrI-like domain-containing protein [Sulfurovum sp.]
MPNIQKVDITSKRIIGFKTRIENADEMHPDTKKIGALWGRFIAEVSPAFPHYGVYHNYDEALRGHYDLLAGIEGEPNEGFDSVNIQGDRYLKFSAKGELHQAVMQCWEQVWAYFQDVSIDERRAYETDFEVYRSMDEVEIYIGVHYL